MSPVSLSFACAVCFGTPDSLSTKAVLTAAFFLLAVVVAVLTAIGWTAFAWTKRAKTLENYGRS